MSARPVIITHVSGGYPCLFAPKTPAFSAISSAAFPPPTFPPLPLFSLFARDFGRSATVLVRCFIWAVMLSVWASFALDASLMLARFSAVLYLSAMVALAISLMYFLILSPTSAMWLLLLYLIFPVLPPLFCVYVSKSLTRFSK